MQNDNTTVRYTADELNAKREHGEGRLDRERLAALSDADIEAQAADEPDFDWANAEVGVPPKKTQLTMRLDQDVIDWFRGHGRGYQTRINAVLRHYVQAHKQDNDERHNR